MKKHLIVSNNIMFDEVRKHFSKDYNVIKPISANDNSQFIDRDEILDRLSKLKVGKKSKFSPGMLPIIGQKVANGMAHCFAIQDAVEKLHKEEGIAGVVLHSCGGTPGNALVKVCKKLGIPTFVLLNGIWPGSGIRDLLRLRVQKDPCQHVPSCRSLSRN